MQTQHPYRIPPDVAPSALEALAERLPTAVIVLQAPDRVLWMNARASEIFGERPHVIFPHVAGALAGRDVSDVRIEVEHDRRPLVLKLTAAPLPRGRGRVVVVCDDVTQRDRRERAEAEFVDNAAHQLRNPVAAIAASMAALRAGARHDPAELERFLGHIEREGERLGNLVNGLLALAALQRGDALPNVEVVSLTTLLHNAATAAPPGACIRIACEDDIAVVTHRGLLTQAVGNVIANAVEHSQSEVRVDTHVEGATVVVEIRDDGAGVPPEVGERVFERFFRAPGERRAGGSGLGLAIASAAAEAAQSTLELLPQENGSGAAFRFTVAGATRR